MKFSYLDVSQPKMHYQATVPNYLAPLNMHKNVWIEHF